MFAGLFFAVLACADEVVLVDRTMGAAGLRDFLGRAFFCKAGGTAFPKELDISIISPEEHETSVASSLIWIEEDFAPASGYYNGKKSSSEVFALIPVIVLVSADCPVDNLSIEELKRIYSGRIDNWSQIKGGSMVVRVAGAAVNSAESRIFRKTVMQQDIFSSIAPAPGNDILPDMMICNTPETAEKLIRALPGMVVFGSWKLANIRSGSCKVLKINNVDPTVENIAARRYPLTAQHLMRYEQVMPQEKIRKMAAFLKESASLSGKSVLAK